MPFVDTKGMSSVDTAPMVVPTLINSGVLLATMSTLISPNVAPTAPSLDVPAPALTLSWLSQMRLLSQRCFHLIIKRAQV
jgi:hypothetical protein